MTSNSRESSPSMPNEISFGIDPKAPIIFGSLQEFLKVLDDELNKIPEEKPKIHPNIQPIKKVELVESGSFLDFFLGGFNAKKNPNLAPLNNPPIPLGMLKANHQHNQNPFLDFLESCIPKEQKPSNKPSNFRSENLSGLPQSARYC
jgi:hypothetical protein